MAPTDYHRLSEDLDNVSITNDEKYEPPKKKSRVKRAGGVLAAALSLGLYTAAVLYYAQEVIHKPYCPRFAASDTVHLWDQVGYKPMGFNPATPHHSDGFLGKPNPELDRNWRKLLLTFSSRLPDSEAQKLGDSNDAIPFDDGKGGYVGGIAVVHNLHCIMTKKAHCLHHLLGSSKCQADMTPVLLHWSADDYIPVLRWDGVQRSCVDWERLMSWGEEHSMVHSETMSSVSHMKHPIFGNFLDEHGKFVEHNVEGVVDFEEFSQREDYKKWAREQGIGTGKEDAERFLEEFAREQNKQH
ncbi:hypothetical protein OOU_Y34scaffold00502g21 [Pyricularia oryzae Y34]|uniref:Uncharacterized protein n=1 Tax=Pyricularia oryzae (strain Y34) TaxID=1143189 RepID=A0AA97NZS5_PYRO3|nr:hypothetical protein OOU_Y34scaffold00502g21 [Pyricularia oryzae Y34]